MFVIVRVSVIVRMLVKVRVFVSFGVVVNVRVRVRVAVARAVVRGRFAAERSAQLFPHGSNHAAADFARIACASRSSQAPIPSPLRVEMSRIRTPG